MWENNVLTCTGFLKNDTHEIFFVLTLKKKYLIETLQEKKINVKSRMLQQIKLGYCKLISGKIVVRRSLVRRACIVLNALVELVH